MLSTMLKALLEPPDSVVLPRRSRVYARISEVVAIASISVGAYSPHWLFRLPPCSNPQVGPMPVLALEQAWGPANYPRIEAR